MSNIKKNKIAILIFTILFILFSLFINYIHKHAICYVATGIHYSMYKSISNKLCFIIYKLYELRYFIKLIIISIIFLNIYHLNKKDNFNLKSKIDKISFISSIIYIILVSLSLFKINLFTKVYNLKCIACPYIIDFNIFGTILFIILLIIYIVQYIINFKKLLKQKQFSCYFAFPILVYYICKSIIFICENYVYK